MHQESGIQELSKDKKQVLVEIQLKYNNANDISPGFIQDLYQMRGKGWWSSLIDRYTQNI